MKITKQQMFLNEPCNSDSIQAYYINQKPIVSSQWTVALGTYRASGTLRHVVIRLIMYASKVFGVVLYAVPTCNICVKVLKTVLCKEGNF